MRNNQMKAIIWDGTDYPASLTYGLFDVPRPPAGWVLVNTLAAGICGSDVHLLVGDTKYLVPRENFPAILGHENAGVVVSTGDGVNGFTPGDRVAIEPILSCMLFGDSCPMCRAGRYHLCQRGLTHLGMPLTRMLPGGFGEFSIVPESRLFPIPDHVSFQEAALLDILAVNVHAAHIGRPGTWTTAAVVGCGVVGLNMIQLLRVEGVQNVIAIAKHAFQAEIAQLFGATETILFSETADVVQQVMALTQNWGVDQVYECVGGHTDAVALSLEICCPGGSVIMLGGASQCRAIDLQRMLLKEVNLLSSNSYSTFGYQREAQIAVDLLKTGKIDHRPLITHTFAPEDFREAFEVAIHKGRSQAIKPMFVREASTAL